MARVTFKPYTKQQLQTILNTRLEGACEGIDGMSPEKVMAPDAITFASMKVSSISGDARRVLDICRFVDLVSAATSHAENVYFKDGPLNKPTTLLVPLQQYERPTSQK
jgi:Cdc6-like AAA superfamily ATPase